MCCIWLLFALLMVCMACRDIYLVLRLRDQMDSWELETVNWVCTNGNGNTRRAYDGAFGTFVKFCDSFGRVALTAVPATLSYTRNIFLRKERVGRLFSEFWQRFPRHMRCMGLFRLRGPGW